MDLLDTGVFSLHSSTIEMILRAPRLLQARCYLLTPRIIGSSSPFPESVFGLAFLSRKVFKIEVFLLRRIFFFLKVCLVGFQDRSLLPLPDNLLIQVQSLLSLLLLMEVEKFRVKCRGWYCRCLVLIISVLLEVMVVLLFFLQVVGLMIQGVESKMKGERRARVACLFFLFLQVAPRTWGVVPVDVSSWVLCLLRLVSMQGFWRFCRFRVIEDPQECHGLTWGMQGQRSEVFWSGRCFSVHLLRSILVFIWWFRAWRWKPCTCRFRQSLGSSWLQLFLLGSLELCNDPKVKKRCWSWLA